MSLETERERTKVLANKAKVCLTNINGALNEAGASEANTLQDVPARIWSIFSGLKRTAKGTCDIALIESKNKDDYKNYTIPLNLDFKPSTFYISGELGLEDYTIIILDDGIHKTTISTFRETTPEIYSDCVIRTNGSASSVSSNNAIINISASMKGTSGFRITEWLAIE